MLLVEPFHQPNLTHTWQATLAHGEKILAYARLPPERILSTEWGLLIHQGGATRRWLGPLEGPPEYCHLLDAIELDHFAVHALLSHKIGNIPVAEYIGLCPWQNVPAAATYLRTRCLASHINPYTAQSFHLSSAAYTLKITEQPPNGGQLPSYSSIRSETLFRLDPDTAKTAHRYFNLADSSAEPAISELGADSYLVYATASNPEEPLRMILTNQLFLPVARRELVRWLKSFNRNRREVSTS